MVWDRRRADRGEVGWQRLCRVLGRSVGQSDCE